MGRRRRFYMNLNRNFVKYSMGIFARFIKKRFDEGPNPNHYDEEGNDYRGFNLDGIHKVTGPTRDASGLNEWGIDLEGYNLEGYDNRGFNREGIHCITKTKFNPSGYDVDEYLEDGFHWYSGVHKVTGKMYDESGNDRRGFNENKIHKKTGTNLDERNRDVDGKYGLPVHCPKCNGTDHENLTVGRSCHMPLTPFPNKRCNDCGRQWYDSHF